MTSRNPAGALGGGIPLCFHIWHYWPAASDERRSAALNDLWI
jgi:hypothetical protein